MSCAHWEWKGVLFNAFYSEHSKSNSLKQELFTVDKMVPAGHVVHCAPGLEQVSQLSTSVQAENK